MGIAIRDRHAKQRFAFRGEPTQITTHPSNSSVGPRGERVRLIALFIVYSPADSKENIDRQLFAVLIQVCLILRDGRAILGCSPSRCFPESFQLRRLRKPLREV
jgi:hypothetical protein